MLCITNAPKWAEGPAVGLPGTWPSPAKFAQFVPCGGAALQRHVHSLRADGAPAARAVLGGVERAERGKQPRARSGSTGALASPAHYRKMVNAFADAVRAVASSNKVVAGTLGPFAHDSKDIQVAPPMQFMSDLLCVSMQPPHRKTCSTRTRFDIWAHNAYANGGPDWKAKIPGNASIGELPEMRALLLAAKRQGTVVSSGQPLFWVTEFSWDTKPPDPKGVPQRLHARWVSEALFRMWRAGVSAVIWYRLQDDPLRTSPYQSGFFTTKRSSEVLARGLPVPLRRVHGEGRRLGLGTHTLRQARRGDRGAQDQEPLGRSRASPCRPLRHLLRTPQSSAGRHDCVPCPARRPRGAVDPVLAHGSADAARRSIRLRWQDPCARG